MSAYFVTATGTDIGKTFVTAGLIRHFRASGLPVDALKPIVSGFNPLHPEGSDPVVLLEALGSDVSPGRLERISPWRFEDPLSPDMAAARAGRMIEYDRLMAFCRRAIETRGRTLFIEGVGGVMVPLDDRHSVLDWMSELAIPAIVVAGSYLGTISHTLTALDVLRRAKIEIAALVINESDNSTVPMAETLRTLERFAGEVPIAKIDRASGQSEAGAGFASLARLLR